MAGNLEIPGISCDICGKTLLVDESVRYVVEIKVYAAYDPMEITRADYEKDHGEEIRKLLEACREMTPEELEDQVYRDFRFHICPGCQKEYLHNPLGTKGFPGPPEGTTSRSPGERTESGNGETASSE